jgi:hypothetical protein
LAFVKVGGRDLRTVSSSRTKVTIMDISMIPADAPDHAMNLLFIHHSIGGQWLADPGMEQGTNAIYVTHPNGGGLRGRLERQGYVVHEASYGSVVGERTDLFDWLPKFVEHMPQVLACSRQDETLAPPARNQIIVFKSCFPNNMFAGAGQAPGDPRGGDLTLAYAQATYRALLPEFEKFPEVLFVCLTTPPLAPRIDSEPLWKAVAKKLAGKVDRKTKLLGSAALARQFANWLKSDDGWLKGYPQRNVIVFDYYDILTGAGSSDLLQFPTGEGYDSHPSAEGQRLATEAFVPFLNRAVRRAGIGSIDGPGAADAATSANGHASFAAASGVDLQE